MTLLATASHREMDSRRPPAHSRPHRVVVVLLAVRTWAHAQPPAYAPAVRGSQCSALHSPSLRALRTPPWGCKSQRKAPRGPTHFRRNEGEERGV